MSVTSEYFHIGDKFWIPQGIPLNETVPDTDVKWLIFFQGWPYLHIVYEQIWAKGKLGKKNYWLKVCIGP